MELDNGNTKVVIHILITTPCEAKDDDKPVTEDPRLRPRSLEWKSELALLVHL
jgi:hypothetical protein